MIWESLKQSALIGSEKKPLDYSTLPAPIRNALPPDDGASSETQLLLAAAFSVFYQDAGSKAHEAHSIHHDTYTNTLAEADPEAMNLLSVIMSLDARIKVKLIRLWLKWLIKDQRVIAPASAVKLVQFTENMGAEVRSMVGQVLGEKGRWMLTFYPNQQFLPEKHTENSWEEGTPDQRRNYWAEVRQHNHQQSMALLLSGWDAESITFKKSILNRLIYDVRSEDLPYLEKWYHEEFAYRPDEKTMQTECRVLLTTSLLSLPQSELYRQVTESLKPYLLQQKKSGLLGLISSTSTTISLPPEKYPDPFWNAGHMKEILGFSDQYDIATYKSVNEYWLGLLIENLPATFWLQHFPKGMETLIDYLLGPEYQISGSKKVIKTFEEALINHAIYHRNAEMALMLLKKVSLIKDYRLYNVLHQSDFEKLIVDNSLWYDINVLEQSPTESWSPGFSKTMLQETMNLAETNPYMLSAPLGAAIGYRLHEDMRSQLDRALEKMKDHQFLKNWKNHIYEPALTSLTLKKALKATLQ